MSISNDLRRLRGNSKMARAVWTESKFLLLYIKSFCSTSYPPTNRIRISVFDKTVL